MGNKLEFLKLDTPNLACRRTFISASIQKMSKLLAPIKLKTQATGCASHVENYKFQIWLTLETLEFHQGSKKSFFLSNARHWHPKKIANFK